MAGTTTTTWWALVRAHAHGGSRAALRSGTIGVSMVIFAFGMAPDPGYSLMRFVVGIVAPEWDGRWTMLPPPRLGIAAFALALAGLGARRVTAGATGWMASLPVSSRTARRAAWGAATLAALPVVIFLALAVLVARPLYHTTPTAGALVGLPSLLAAAGAATVPVRRAASRLLALLALVAATRPDAIGLVASLALLGAWDVTAGGLTPPFPRPFAWPVAWLFAWPFASPFARPFARPFASPFARRAWSRPRQARTHGAPTRGNAGAALLALRWAWRAAGGRTVLEALLLATVPVGFTVLARRNNADLDAATLDVIGRIGGGIGVVAAVIVVAAGLLARRGAWAWPRALPWSAGRRVTIDTIAIALPALVVTLASLALFGVASLPATLGALAVVAPVAAGALRAGAGRQTGASGEPGLYGLVVVSLVAWFPWLALACAPLAWLLLRRAAERERRHAGAVRFNELRHDLAGDAGWISRT